MILVCFSFLKWMRDYKSSIKRQIIESGETKWKHLSLLANTRHNMTDRSEHSESETRFKCVAHHDEGKTLETR